MASVCAAFALKAVFEPTMSGGVTVPTVGLSQAFALEFIISFNLMFVVTAVATDTRAVNYLSKTILKNLELWSSEKTNHKITGGRVGGNCSRSNGHA